MGKTPRKEALARGEKRYTGKVCNEHPEQNGLRCVGNGNCVKCLEEHRQTPEYRERNRKRWRARLKTDDQFRFAMSLRRDIHRVLKRAGAKKNLRTHELMGCSPAFYMGWIESKWEPGWSWKKPRQSLAHRSYTALCIV